MDSVSKDDVAYAALLSELLFDTTSTRNARVHSWIKHQYDFALSEHRQCEDDAPFRPPSPSPSSSLGAHRTVDETCPSYDALFFPLSHDSSLLAQDTREQIRALRFIVRQMASQRHQNTSSPPHPTTKKPLPTLPQSHTCPLVQSNSSSTISTRASRLLSGIGSPERIPQDIPFPLADDHARTCDEPIISPSVHGQEQEDQLLCDTRDCMDSVRPSPTCSDFSFRSSRETSYTTPAASSAVSPTSAVFSSFPCSPENIALPASPFEDQTFFSGPTTGSAREKVFPPPDSKPTTSHSPSSFSFTFTKNIPPVSPTSHLFHAQHSVTGNVSQQLHPPSLAEDSRSRWSATTVTLNSESPPNNVDDKAPEIPKKRSRLMNLISRFAPSRTAMPSTSTITLTGEDPVYESAYDSDVKDKETDSKHRKSSSRKSSLASIRPSFSLSRTSFGSLRPPLSSSTIDAPPLPISPTQKSSLADVGMTSEVTPPSPKGSASRIPSQDNLKNASSMHMLSPKNLLEPTSSSGVSTALTPQSHAYPSWPDTAPGASRVALSPLKKQVSLPPTQVVEPMTLVNPAPASHVPARPKSIVRLSEKPKNIKTPIPLGTRPVAPSFAGTPSTIAIHSAISTEFVPPAKLATLITAQTGRTPPFAARDLSSPRSASPVLPTLRRRANFSRSTTMLNGEKPGRDRFDLSLTAKQAPDTGVYRECTCTCRRCGERKVFLS